MNTHCRVLSALLLLIAASACSDSNPMQPVPPPPPAARDSDGDGIIDSLDKCPTQAETRNGVFDRDGCPDTPRDLYQAVRADVETFWNSYFSFTLSRPYLPITGLQFFSNSILSPCGLNRGPFYCGFDRVVYLDEPFLDGQLSRIGDFAAAVVIAHEIGHHTQNLLGLLGAISIQKELQADCLAGGWAASAGARGLLDAGDFQEAARSLFEASDPLGTPWFAPSAHGTAAQRQQAFSTGFFRGAIGC